MTTFPHIDTHLDVAGLQAVQERIAKKWPEVALTLAVRELTAEVSAEEVSDFLTFLKNDGALQFTQLMDVCGVDYLGAKHRAPARFAVVYHLLSLAQNQRIRVKVYVEDGTLVPTACGVYPTANWYERETYDMYGIVFDGHPDLRRILTDYGFDGHPLRKDFPLEGFTEVYYDAKEKRVAYKPVDLPQEFRKFNDVSEWRGMTGNAKLADADNTFDRKDFE